jgi:Spy/CpxP family protein refolding chaperone
MKKILALALTFSAVALLACPMQGGAGCGSKCGGGMGLTQKCGCDTSKLPPHLEALGLSDTQKKQIQKIRTNGKEFHNKQHDKMMAVLTPDQKKKLTEVPKACPKEDLQMPAAPACKACPEKKN